MIPMIEMSDVKKFYVCLVFYYKMRIATSKLQLFRE